MLTTVALAQDQTPAPAQVETSTSASKQEKAPAARVPKADSLKALEDNLFRPLQESLNPDHTLDPPLQRPGARSPTQNKKLRDALDRKKNWIFMTPEEILGNQKPNELLGQDGKSVEEQEMTPMQRYMFRRLNPTKDSKANNPNGKRDPLDSNKRDPWSSSKDSLRDGAQKDEDSNNSENRADAREKKDKKDGDKGSGKENESKQRTTSFFSDIFGISRPEPTKEQERAEKQRLDAFKKSLGLPITPSFAAGSVSPYLSLPDSSPVISPVPKPVDTSPVSSMPSGFGPQLGTIPTMPTLPSVTPMQTPAWPTVGGQTFSPAVLPTPTPSKTLPQQPTFSAPRRSF
jgi:hypothetical protein